MNPELQALEKMLQMGLKSKADLAGLDEQHAVASALRDTPDYKGNSRGQQSIFGHLANTVQKNTGKRQLKELAGQREAARANVAAAGNALPMYKLQQEQKAIELAAKNRSEDRDWAKDDIANANAFTAGQDLLKAKALADEQKAKRGDSNRLAVWVLPNGSDPITVEETANGTIHPITREPVNTDGRIKYEHHADATNYAKSKSKKGGKKDGDAMSKTAKPDIVKQVLDSKFLPDATGAADVDRVLGGFGLDTSDFNPINYVTDAGKQRRAENRTGEEIQALDMKISDVGINTVKENLEGLGINPTDRDLEVAFQSVPDNFTQPQAWAIWARDLYLPMLKKAASEGIAQGTITEQDAREYVNSVTKSMEARLSNPDGLNQGSPMQVSVPLTTDPNTMSDEELDAELAQ